VILVLIQVGGFGIMTAATLLSMLVSSQLRLTDRLIVQAEVRAGGMDDIRALVFRIGATVLICEAVVAAVLTVRLRQAYDLPVGDAVWYGVFHAVSSFNNAGFSTFSDNLMGFVADWWICGAVIIAIIVGGAGFPVLLELMRRLRRPSTWSTHTRITVFGTVFLLSSGLAATLIMEWANPATLGPLGVGTKVLAAAFHSTSSRTAGFNTVDMTALHPETWAVTDVLMFIGGGSAGTAGGIKVTTFFLLAFVIWSEITGEPDVVVGRRRIAGSTVRQALAVVLLGFGLVATATLALLMITDESLDRVLFEAVSAFATVGLSTGITGDLPAAAQLILVMLMFVGRVGTITVAAALALNTRHRLYRLPEERPIVG
jgi:Trk-type K+ transport system membrane component